MQWFSEPQETIKAAQQLHQPQPLEFNPAAVFETPQGQYVMALLRRNTNWPPVEAVQNIEQLTGNRVVSTCDPIFGIWKPFTVSAT